MLYESAFSWHLNYQFNINKMPRFYLSSQYFKIKGRTSIFFFTFNNFKLALFMQSSALLLSHSPMCRQKKSHSICFSSLMMEKKRWLILNSQWNFSATKKIEEANTKSAKNRFCLWVCSIRERIWENRRRRRRRRRKRRLMLCVENVFCVLTMLKIISSV